MLRTERQKAAQPYGDLPLVVLTRGISDAEGPDGKALEEEHKRDHAAVAALSRKGKQVFASRSGHHIQIDEPDLVISTIREVLAAASAQPAKRPATAAPATTSPLLARPRPPTRPESPPLRHAASRR